MGTITFDGHEFSMGARMDECSRGDVVLLRSGEVKYIENFD